MNFAVALATFPVIFLGELPDKTMFASLVLATRGRPFLVWIGAASAFLIHVVIATTIGAGLLQLLPTRATKAVVAVLFLAGAVVAVIESTRREVHLIEREVASHRVVTSAFLVIFVAEWGDLTQVLTANLAAHYHSAVSVAVGATLGLWSVAAIAVVGSRGLLRNVNVQTVRVLTAVILVVLALLAGWSALR